MIQPLTEKELVSLLICAESSSHFLSEFFRSAKANNSKYSLSFFSRQFGFKSKGYLSDVASSKRQLTVASAHKIARTLRLNPTAYKYLMNLVDLETSSFSPDLRLKVESENQRLKFKLQARLNFESLKTDFKSIDYRWPRVYASLVDPDNGVTASQVEKFSHMPLQQCEMILNQLVQQKLIEKKVDRYFPSKAFIELSDPLLKSIPKYFYERVQIAARQSQLDFKNKEKLFMVTTISVDKAALTAIREKLRETFNSALEEAESPTGNQLIDVTLTLT
jgi:uncharacterized protein (TIGR02147 family)